MSDFDEELEDDLEDSAPSDESADDFEDPQQTTAALTKEINKLRQKNEVLRQFNVRQKDKYKDEVRSFLTPLIQKYKDIQVENDFLKRQIKEISQNTSLSKSRAIGENGGNGHTDENSDLVQVMENTIEEKEREISVLNKMVKTLEEESFSLKRDIAELPEVRDALKAKSEKLSKIEEEKYDLASKAEAKDSLVTKYLKQISDLETNVYVLNKRISERTGQFETGKVSEYEDKLQSANQQMEKLQSRISTLEKQLADYQDTMSSLEEELDEDTFLNKNDSSSRAVASAVAPATTAFTEEVEEKPAFDYTKLYKNEDSNSQTEIDDYSSEDLPSDDDLLAHEIDLEEMPEDDDLEEVSDDLVESLLGDDDIDLDSELEIADLPVGEYDDAFESTDVDALLDDSDLALDDLPIDSEEPASFENEEDQIDLDKDEVDGFNPLDQFDTSDDIFDEDRDTASSPAKKG